MAGEVARAAVEAGAKAAMDLSLTVPGCSISLKIDNVWLAGAVSIGAFTLGAFYLARKGPSEDAIRRALERTDTSGVVDPQVMNITDGHSILVELHCHTETSFLLFLEDFEKKTVKFRLEEEFKKIGFEHGLDVTIRNAEEVYEKARQIRERSRAPREGEETAYFKKKYRKEHSHLLHGKTVDESESTVEAKDTPETVLGKRKRKTEKDSDDRHPKEKQSRQVEEQKTQMIDIHIIVENVSRTGGPAKSSRASTPAKSSLTSTPAKSSLTSTPAKSSRTSTPAKSSRTSTRAKSSRTSTPAKSSSTSTPAKSSPRSTPAKSSPRSTPAKSSQTSTRAKSSRTSTPAKSSRTSTPAKSSPRLTPAKSSRTSTPAKSSPRSTPTKSSPRARSTPARSRTPEQFEEEEEEGSPLEHEQVRAIWSAIMSVEGPVDDFLSQYLESKLNLIVGSHRIGNLDLFITVECRSLQILEELWEDYCSGHFNEMVQEMIVTPCESSLEKFGVTDVKLKTFISEGEYERGKQILSLEKLGVTDVKLKTFISEEEYERHTVREANILKDDSASPSGWSAAQRQRLAVEKELLDKYFRNKVTWIDPTRPDQTKVEVRVTCSNDKQYTLRVYIPSDFPNSCPDMVVKTSAKLKARNGENLDDYQGDNHIGRTRDGYTGISHSRPNLWRDNNTLYQVVMKGLIWLEAYEAHLRTGKPLSEYLSAT